MVRSGRHMNRPTRSDTGSAAYNLDGIRRCLDPFNHKHDHINAAMLQAIAELDRLTALVQQLQQERRGPSMKFRYYIVNLFDGTVSGRNDLATAEQYALSDDFFVIDSESGEHLVGTDREDIQVADSVDADPT